MTFDRFLLILPSGAGGYVDSADQASELAARLDLHGWVLGCRSDGSCAGGRRQGRRSMKRMSVAVLRALAEPDDQALAGALEVAGNRHMIEYRLVS
jgi:hypothetical protein